MYEQHEPLHRCGMVGREPVRHARSPVVRQHAEAFETVVCHDGDGIQRHLSLAVVDVRCIGQRPRRVAVAAHIHQHHGEVLGQRGRHTVPHDHALRVPVQQQQGRSSATDARMQRHAFAGHGVGHKCIQHGHQHSPHCGNNSAIY